MSIYKTLFLSMVNLTFAVVEFCDSQVLLQREQHYLDILFSLPDNLRYNFARFAEAPFKGLTHTPGSKAQMSDSQSGANNPMSGKTHSPETLALMSDSKSGANNPMYGRSGPLNPMYGRTGALNPMFGKY